MSEKQYFGILTEIGEIKEANALALGVRRKITHMGVCDGNNGEFQPDRKMRELPGLKRKALLNTLKPDEKNPGWIIAEQIIPENEGGFWIRGYGLYDEDNDLVAVANCPPSYKPVLASGSGKTQVIRMVLLVGSVASYELKIDPSVVLATREHVAIEAAKKLGKTETAVAAEKLATGRSFLIKGGATAKAVTFDGTGNVELDVTGLDMSKASAGTLAVARGGTGLSAVQAGTYLKGVGANLLGLLTPDQVLADIKALPSAGGSMSGPLLLSASGSLGTEFGAPGNVRAVSVSMPAGAYYTGHASLTGALKITMPTAAVGLNSMIRMRISIFEYATNATPATLYIQGYARETKIWATCSAWVVSGNNFYANRSVRFGFDESFRPVVWIGDLDSSWFYPMVQVEHAHIKYNAIGASLANWGSGWTCELVTQFDTVSVTGSVTSPYAQSDDLKADKSTTVSAGNGLTGGGNLSTNRTLTLGTPAQITATSTNAVQTNGHSHAVDKASETVQGIIKIATTAIAQGLTDDVLAITAKKLDDAFKGANQSLSSISPYQRLGGGWWLVCGGFTFSGATVTNVTFPMAFPTRCFAVWPVNPSQGIAVTTTSITNTGASISYGSGISTSGAYLAIGW